MQCLPVCLCLSVSVSSGASLCLSPSPASCSLRFSKPEPPSAAAAEAAVYVDLRVDDKPLRCLGSPALGVSADISAVECCLRKPNATLIQTREIEKNKQTNMTIPRARDCSAAGSPREGNIHLKVERPKKEFFGRMKEKAIKIASKFNLVYLFEFYLFKDFLGSQPAGGAARLSWRLRVCRVSAADR